jgi:ribosomal protein S27AE
VTHEFRRADPHLHATSAGLTLPCVDTRIPVIVRMRVECARCGHSEDDTYEFDIPFAKAQAMEAYEPGTCPKCGAPIQMHLKRTQQRQ